MRSTDTRHLAMPAASAGILMATYLLLRPYGDADSATSPEAAAAYASQWWVVAHLAGADALFLLSDVVLADPTLTGEGSAERDHHGRVIGRALALAFLPVDHRVGHPSVTLARLTVRCLALDGRIVMIATMQGAKVDGVDLREIMKRRARLTGSMLRPRSVAEKGEIARDLHEHVWPLLEAGRVAPVIERVFAFEDVAKAHAELEAGSHVGKIMLRLGD